MHRSLSTTGYQNPSMSIWKEIASLGHTSPQALHPQHLDLSVT